MFKAMARAAGKISEPKVPVATVVAAGASYVLGRISTKLRVRVEELPPPVSELKSSKKKLSMKLKDNKISYGWKKKSLPGEDVEVDTTTTVMTALGAAVVGAFLGGLTFSRRIKDLMYTITPDEVAEKILNGKELELYKWDGDLSQLLQSVCLGISSIDKCEDKEKM